MLLQSPLLLSLLMLALRARGLCPSPTAIGMTSLSRCRTLGSTVTRVSSPSPSESSTRLYSNSPSSPVSSNGNKGNNQQQGKAKAKAKASGDDDDRITPMKEDFSAWYGDVIKHGQMAETSPTRGSMIIKPWGMGVWENMRDDMDRRIKSHGVENAYFPLLIPKGFLSQEAEHVDGFAKECAVVTHHRLKAKSPDDPTNLIPDPDAQLEEPLVIRPTSETIIWSTFRKWITSHRDLPLKINQWANVLRWELRTRPFLRTSEFLWQEGHTAHATAESAEDDARAMIEEYRSFAEETLAVPTVVGVKSPSERFAGAENTYTIEALMSNGWALQAGTSHYLGTSFGSAFNVKYQDVDAKQQTVYGSSWGVSTRLVGALIMSHGDDLGLVLPPNVAPVQAVVVPIRAKKNDVEGQEALDAAVENLVKGLTERGIRVKVDDREHVRNGAKYYEWERKGVPLRIEIGPRDVGEGACVLKWRKGDGEKIKVELGEVSSTVEDGMGKYQGLLLEEARERLAAGITLDATYDDMKIALAADEASTYPGPGLYLVPWKCDAENEEKIKEECKATIRCYPLDVNSAGMWQGKKCFYSGDDATHMALFGRAF